MSTLNQELWHCLITHKGTSTVEFYNQYGLELEPLNGGELFVSRVAPMCILEKDHNNKDYGEHKSMLLWTKQTCPEFTRAFPELKQFSCANLEKVEVANKCNFNR